MVVVLHKEAQRERERERERENVRRRAGELNVERGARCVCVCVWFTMSGDNKKPHLSNAISHLKSLRQHNYNRELIQVVIELINANDHDSLAFVARTTGVPPQLRHIVWPILLKYHPMCISPNIISNTVAWDPTANNYTIIAENTDEEQQDIRKDLLKYFPLKHQDSPDANQFIDILHDAIVSFLAKWSQIFKYEIGLTWVALGLAEWFPPSAHSNDDPVVLQGFKRGSSCISHLYNEYPLPTHLKTQLPKIDHQGLDFKHIYERVLLVILNCPDTMHHNTNNASNYFPIISGGDLSFRIQLFFKIFDSILPELYQPLTEESNLETTSNSKSWLYWWIKFSGAYILQKQDRARIWDLLFGWRPTPDFETINFYLKYNTKKFNHLYSTTFHSNGRFLQKITKNDPFWFPDLDSIPIGTPKYTTDVHILKELLIRNMSNGTSPQDGDDLENQIPFSLINPHMQLLFIYIAILQHNEFKLLEFEEPEIIEFLNNIPMLSKIDDSSFKKMLETKFISNEKDPNTTTVTPESSPIPSQSSSSSTSASGTSAAQQSVPNSNHMLIELGNDGKASYSFNNILNMAGDIWRKWLWGELVENSDN